MLRLCDCGRHHRHDDPYPERLEVIMATESICVTQDGDECVSYTPGRQYGQIRLRVSARLIYRLVTWHEAWQRLVSRSRGAIA